VENLAVSVEKLGLTCGNSGECVGKSYDKNKNCKEFRVKKAKGRSMNAAAFWETMSYDAVFRVGRIGQKIHVC